MAQGRGTETSPCPISCHPRTGSRGEIQAGGRQKHHTTEQGGRCGEGMRAQRLCRSPPKHGAIPTGNRCNNEARDGWGQKKNMIQERICLSQARETSAPSDNTVNGIVKKIYNACGPRAPAEMIPGTLTNKAIHTAFCRFPVCPKGFPPYIFPHPDNPVAPSLGRSGSEHWVDLAVDCNWL